MSVMLFLDFGQADIRNPLRYLLDSVKYLSPASGSAYPDDG